MSLAQEQTSFATAMDGLLIFLDSHSAPKEEINLSSFKTHLKQVYSAQDGMIEEDKYLNTMNWLSQIQAMTFEDAMKLLEILCPQFKGIGVGNSAENEKDITTATGYTGNIIDEYEENANIQTVPDADTRSDVATASLDTRSRRRTSPVKRYQTSSTAEGSRLRGRNRAAMTNEEYDALANNIQPGLVDDITRYAAQTGIGPSHSADTGASEQTHKDYPTLSDPERSGFSTPHVSRKAIRRHMCTIGRPSQSGVPGSYNNMPISPDSSFHEPHSPIREILSPARYAEHNDERQKQIQELLNNNMELQKSNNEKTRRLELEESQNEKRTAGLEQNLDECKAELTMKKRDIERLKQSEKNYSINLKVAEGEIERLGVMLSNEMATSADLRHQLDKKTSQAAEADCRVLDSQSEIIKLKAELNNNFQQQEQLAKEYRRLKLKYQELEHELRAAHEYRDEAQQTQKENARLNEQVETLNRDLSELRLQLQQQHQQSETAGSEQDIVDGQRLLRPKYRSLQDELAGSENQDLDVDDINYAALASTDKKPTLLKRQITEPKTISVAVGPTDTDTRDLGDAAVRQWICDALSRCSSEDLVILSEVWKRIEYCDTSTEKQGDLRHELIEVFMAPYKYGLKEAIRSRSNATLTRIVDNVAGEYNGMRLSAGHQYGNKTGQLKGSNGLVQVLATGQYTTVAIILYSVVLFCLGIITASYFNISQPLATSVPFGVTNGTAATSAQDSADGGAMNIMRHILVVDDTPVHKYYTPLRKRNPRSRFGEILFYWMETLLWDDADIQVPT
ncbi:hypothetical protein COEREDRAFT_79418 [Coemansia reversa NRRL 1564]|uniref:Uncharacterized protein n=1 Tax=Coemansia reversa (strain ATCC 12441 / NRRL 1564) TaxID=763665 RepID=A0A2G5BIR7_COERN|nr:hypothetical protein COEREDRAFT_79418 [Coemansia reversa NRRL 1564]|eukprot:PIA18871.1 hypothetical protein COEREDRAFT_79418 [Coemansia reversa NRRL 1564]